MSQKVINFRLDAKTLKAMAQGGERVVSKFMERNVTDFIFGNMKLDADDFETKQTSISLPLPIARELEARAEQLGVEHWKKYGKKDEEPTPIPLSKLLRVIAEKAVAAEKEPRTVPLSEYAKRADAFLNRATPDLASSVR